MALTQFAMVEELALLIKDNLLSKHLVLSTEELLVDALQSGFSQDGMLELQPMSSYHRLLLHRLAEIYGFAHESIGEADDRHLVLKRCPESAIPSILVSDILWQYDEYQCPMPSQVILRREAAQDQKLVHNFSPSTFEEREVAYPAARERIFSVDDDDGKEGVVSKPRKVPVVARRMIAHALGQRISNDSGQEASVNKFEDAHAKNLNNETKKRDQSDPVVESSVIAETVSGESSAQPSNKCSTNKAIPANREMHQRAANNISLKGNSLSNDSNGKTINHEQMDSERIGAAKRIFANALGLPSSIANGSHESKSSLKEARQ